MGTNCNVPCPALVQIRQRQRRESRSESRMHFVRSTLLPVRVRFNVHGLMMSLVYIRLGHRPACFKTLMIALPRRGSLPTRPFVAMRPPAFTLPPRTGPLMPAVRAVAAVCGPAPCRHWTTAATSSSHHVRAGARHRRCPSKSSSPSTTSTLSSSSSSYFSSSVIGTTAATTSSTSTSTRVSTQINAMNQYHALDPDLLKVGGIGVRLLSSPSAPSSTADVASSTSTIITTSAGSDPAAGGRSSPPALPWSVLEVELDRPSALNALSSATFAALHKVLDAVAASTTTRGLQTVTHLVFVSRGKAFSAGGDVRALRASMLPHPVDSDDRKEIANIALAAEYDLLARLARVPGDWGVETVAVVDGIAFGAGLGLVQACRTRLVTPRAKLSMPECLIGLVPDCGASYFLVRRVGAQATLRKIVLGTGSSWGPGSGSGSKRGKEKGNGSQEGGNVHRSSRFGMFAALTGNTVNAADAVALGLMDASVPESWDGTQLLSLLCNDDAIGNSVSSDGSACNAFARARVRADSGDTANGSSLSSSTAMSRTDYVELQEALHEQRTYMGDVGSAVRQAIDRVFALDSMDEIVDELKRMSTIDAGSGDGGVGERAELRLWAASARRAIKKASPTAVARTFEVMRAGYKDAEEDAAEDAVGKGKEAKANGEVGQHGKPKRNEVADENSGGAGKMANGERERETDLAALDKALLRELAADAELAAGWDFEEGVRAQLIDKDKKPLFGTHAYKLFYDK